jgi:hypothetical protein
MAEATTALQHFLRWHCPGLGNYQFRAHVMLENFLLEARQQPETTAPQPLPAPTPASGIPADAWNL